MIRQRAARGHHARHGRHQLHPGAQQGHPQGDVQDGHLDAAELLRRADLRGHRPRDGVRRSLLHADRVAHRRRRPRRRSPQEVLQRHARGVPGAVAGAGATSTAGRRVPVAARRRVPPVQPGHGVQAAARDAQRPVPRSSRNTRALVERPEPASSATLRGLLELKRAGARRFRSTRSSRSRRSSSASRPARCRTARSARRRTRRSRSR